MGSRPLFVFYILLILAIWVVGGCATARWYEPGYYRDQEAAAHDFYYGPEARRMDQHR